MTGVLHTLSHARVMLINSYHISLPSLKFTISINLSKVKLSVLVT